MARRATSRKERGTVVALISDVFFGITVRNAIRKLQFEAQMIKTLEELEQSVSVYEPELVVIDMTVLGDDPDAWDVVAETRSSGARVLAFGPHREVEMFKAAKAAGVERVVSNSQFHRSMGQLIERYALASAEDLASDEVEEVEEEAPE